MLGNAGVLYGLNPYLLCVDNPVNLSYNGHTIATNGELAFEPPELSVWQMRWFRVGRFFLLRVWLSRACCMLRQ